MFITIKHETPKSQVQNSYFTKLNNYCQGHKYKQKKQYESLEKLLGMLFQGFILFRMNRLFLLLFGFSPKTKNERI
jgi:hypothetical protein